MIPGLKVIGLTGGIATGKSSVARVLRHRGIPVVDADDAARAVVAPGTPGLAAIVQAFGEGVLTSAGELDRGAMRARIIQDPRARRTLESITHPAIFAHMHRALADIAGQGHRVAVVEAALMVETGSYRLYDALWVVSCHPDTQLERLTSRDDMTEEAARGLIAAQLPLAEKESVADVVLRNDGDLKELEAKVDTLIETLGTGDGPLGRPGATEPPWSIE